jgi:hypothetical protein
MSILFKPTRDEYTQLMNVTNEMQRMFEDVTCHLDTVHRISQIHDRLDKDGGSDEIIQIKRRNLVSVLTFMDKVDHGVDLVLNSPSVGRIALAATAGLVVIAAACTMWKRGIR